MGKAKKPVENTGIKSAVSKALNKTTFDLDDYKKSRNLSENVKFKEQVWIPLSEAFNEGISLPGIPHGHITLLRGHSDTGKTAALIEAAIAFQKAGILPVFIITEMKWSWEHAKTMGFPVEAVPDPETGEVLYTGQFLYVDRDSLECVEDVAAFISARLDEQKRGDLPCDLAFLWDSAGSIPSLQSIQSGKNNALWNAAAMSTQFGNFVNQRITQSRKASSQYTNSFVVVNKIRVEYPTSGNPNEQPSMRNKAGDAMYWDASLVVTFGGVKKAGVAKIIATKNNRKVEWAKRTNIKVDKNHINDVTTTNKIVMTAHGFIKDTKADIDKYKDEHRHEWFSILGEDFDIVEEKEADDQIGEDE